MINKGAYRAFLGIVLGLVGLFWLPGGVFASLPYTQNFDTLSTGNFTAWDLIQGSYFEVIESPDGYFGANILKVDPANLTNYKFDFSPDSSSGVYVSGWIKTQGNGRSNTTFFNYESNLRVHAFGVNGGNLMCGEDNFQAISADTWYWVQAETRTSDQRIKCRWKVYGGELSEWTTYRNNGTGWSGSEALGFVGFYAGASSGVINYDNIIIGSGTAPDGDIPLAPDPDILTLDFKQPPDESSTPDFSNWLLEYQYYTGTTTPLLLYFNIRTLTEAGNYIGDSGQIKMIIPDSTTTQMIFIPKSFVLPNNKWYNATANFWISPENILATSTSHFVVSTTSSAIWQIPPTSTTTSSGFVLTCDPDSTFFQESLCKLGLFLFIPKYEDFGSFLETWDNIKNKIPIGYFTTAELSLETLTTETDGSISFSSLGDFTDYIKNFFTGAFWLLFVFWSFNRIRNLEI